MLYDTTGQTYSHTRQTDPRIAAAIWRHLPSAATVANVGAGAGGYEPPGTVIAVEPSGVMLAQRGAGTPPAVRAVAEQLPIQTKSVDATLAVLTLHHWSDLGQGISELARVARTHIVIFTWDHAVTRNFWLLRDYLPAAAATDASLAVPIDELTRLLPGRVTVTPVPVPADCADGFGAAYWRRPHAYLDPAVQAGMSMLALTPPEALAPGLRQLGADLRNGSWHSRYASLTRQTQLDVGYRVVVAQKDA